MGPVRLSTPALCAGLVLLLLASGAGPRTASAEEKGGMVRVRVDEAALASAHEGERHALLIGVSQFQDAAWSALRYAAKDAEDLARVLKDPERGGFQSVTVLTGAQTTRARVLEALRTLEARPLRPQDVVVVYVSSHGTLARDVRGELQRYVVTSDTSFREVAATGLEMATLERALERLGSKRKVLVLATCHSGTGKSLLPEDVRAELERTKGPAPVRMLEERSRASIILSASDWGEAAREDDTLSNDIYTHFFVQALGGPGDRNLDGAVSATEAHDWARRRTFSYTQGRQRPGAQILEVGADPVVLAGRFLRGGQPELFSYSPRLEGFTLKVDGQEAGELPGGVVVPEGSRTVELTKGGHVLWKDTLVLGAGERRDLAALLERPAGAGAWVLTLGGGGFSFLDETSRRQLVPAALLVGAGLQLPQALLEGQLDLWVDVAAGRGDGSLETPVGGHVPVRHHLLLAGGSIGKSWRWGPLALSTGPRVAALWLQRSFPLELAPGDSYFTVWPGWMAGLSWHFTSHLILGVQGHLLWAYVPTDGHIRTVGFGSAVLSAGYRF